MDDSTTAADPRRAQLALVAAILLAMVAGWLFLGGGLERLLYRPANPTSQADVGQLAPDFTLETASGGTIRLSDLRGKVVLLNFWATWCEPCRVEMPEIEGTYRAHQAGGFEVVAVNLQESADEVRPFMKELGLTFPAALDRDGAVSRLYRARALPSSLLVDRQGPVQYVRVGTLTKQGLEEQ